MSEMGDGSSALAAGSSGNVDPNEVQPRRPSEAGDVASALEGRVNIQDHTEIERDVSAQVRAAALEEENKKDEGRIANLQVKIRKVEEQRASLISQKDQRERARAPRSQVTALEAKIASCKDNIADLLDEISAFEERIQERNQQHAITAAAPQTSGADDAEPLSTRPTQQEGEDRQAFLIRTGKITPFAGLVGPEESEDDSIAQVRTVPTVDTVDSQLQTSHQVLRQPGFASTQIREPIGGDNLADTAASNLETEFSLRPRKRRRSSVAQADVETESDDAGPSRPRRRRRARSADGDADFASEDAPSDASDAEEPELLSSSEDPTKTSFKFTTIDDANISTYNARLSTWVQERQEVREKLGERVQDDSVEEWHRPTPGKPNKTIYEDYVLPEEVYDFLFPFQRVGIKWLAELHRRKEGGILCDEMGLGKTGKRACPLVHSSSPRCAHYLTDSYFSADNIFLGDTSLQQETGWTCPHRCTGYPDIAVGEALSHLVAAIKGIHPSLHGEWHDEPPAGGRRDLLCRLLEKGRSRSKDHQLCGSRRPCFGDYVSRTAYLYR
jgi:DNA excision repair protein ERCC-6